MTILNISEAGMQIEAPYTLQNDSLHEFRLTLGEPLGGGEGTDRHCEIGELHEGAMTLPLGGRVRRTAAARHGRDPANSSPITAGCR